MNNIINILKKELKEMFRDKKSLSMMLIIPFMIPLLVIGMSALFESEVNKPVTAYNKIGFNYELNQVEKSILDNLKIKPTVETTKKLVKDYQEEKIDLYITKDNNTYTINGEENDNTTYSMALVNSYFTAYKETLQSSLLENTSIDQNSFMNIITVKEDIKKTKESENFYGSYITTYAFLFIIMAITVSATYPATDTTAGEKERGTLETLLTFPIKAKDIIIGKYISVSISSIITGLISLILTIISLNIAGGMFEIYKDASLTLSASSIIFSLVTIIAYSFLISGLCIAIASKCKTFKEAQSSLTPLTFISFFPGMIAFMINMKSTTLLSLVPFLNYTLLFSDISKGTVSLLNIILMLLSTIIIIALVMIIIIKQYKSEKVLFSN